jgi:hypothetical protein
MKHATSFLLLCIVVAATIVGCSSATEPENLPQAPSTTSVTSATDSSVTITWTAPSDSSSVTGYRIVVIGPNGDSTVFDLPATTRSINLTGLKPGQSYKIHLHAKQGDKLSDPKNLEWSSPQLPVSPGTVTVTASAGATTATVTWTTPADTGITGYHIWWRAMSGSDSGAMDVAASAQSAQITGLTANVDYTIGVQTMRGTLLSASTTTLLAGDNSPAPAPPSGLSARPVDQTTIAVSWTASSSTNVTGYRVIYTKKSGGQSDSLTTTTTSANITNVQAGSIYTIAVRTLRGAKVSSAITTQSATATRYTTEPDGVTKLRMYEFAAPYPLSAGLTIDPAKGGPKGASTANNPDFSTVQLVWVTNTNSTFDIGPAAAFDEFSHVSDFDQDVYISDSAYSAASLDAWLYTGSIEDRIIPDNGLAFTFSSNGALGQGFFVRTGTTGNYHYARVFIKSVGGKLVQGTGTSRYIELEISYQSAPNVPYAKTSGVWLSPSSVGAHRRR